MGDPVRSLDMAVVHVDGVWLVDAPWLDAPVEAATWHDAYWLACAGRARAAR